MPKLLISKFYKTGLIYLFIILYFYHQPLYAAELNDSTIYFQAVATLNSGDTTLAMRLLEKVLALDPNHWEARLDRGQLHLRRGHIKAARNDFSQAIYSNSALVRASAHIGLGKILLLKPYSRIMAATEFRQAVHNDPSSCEALFLLAETGFGLNDTQGYHMASDALSKLICLDPAYHNAISLWRYKILDQGNKEIRSVTRCLEEYISSHSDMGLLWLDVAWNEYRLGEDIKALEALDKLEHSSPSHKRAERTLLRARCKLELGDTLGFENQYARAIQEAEKDGDFERLFLEAEPTFHPEETEKWRGLKTKGERSAFFHAFWGRRDPDPFTSPNERLVNHYQRLREAEKMFYQHNPHGFLKNSKSFLQLVSPRSIAYDIPPEFLSFLDSLAGRSRPLALDQRGLLYMRLGPPDRAEGTPNEIDNMPPGMSPSEWLSSPKTSPIMESPSHPFTTNRSNVGSGSRIPGAPGAANEPPSSSEISSHMELNPRQVWFYGSTYFSFELTPRAGDFVYIPALSDHGQAGDIRKAMANERFHDPLPHIHQDFYGADFLGEDSSMELEFYHSIPSAAVPLRQPPSSAVALFDNSWTRTTLDSTTCNKVWTGRDSLWLAVDKIQFKPGSRFYSLRMDIPGHRVVSRKELTPRPYSLNSLELSGIVLGSPSDPEYRIYQRKGVELIPRPSLTFRPGEKITVYLEVYGLKPDRTGERSFKERVTVTLVKKKEKGGLPGVSGKIKKMISSGKKSLTSLTLTFDRQPLETAGPVPEHFDINTEELLAGNYFLLVQIQDKSSGKKKQIGCFFKLE